MDDYENTDILPLSEAQTRQYIDAESAWRALAQARQAACEVRGSMMWRTQAGRRYLVRVSASGAQTSLGPASEANAEIFERFMARKQSEEARLRRLRETVQQPVRMNRARRVGRVPAIVVDTLNALAKAGLQEHFMTVGTHALYAYGTACGVRADATATQDIDLRLDARKHLRFVTTMQRLDTSLLGSVQKVDPSFVLRGDQRYTAVNAAGFEIDVIRRAVQGSGADDPHPLRVSAFEDDFRTVQVSTGQALPGGGRFTQMVVATNGRMATMHAPAPDSFVRIKAGLGRRADRDPLKRRKDALQARMVQQLLEAHGLGYQAGGTA
ncbi:GSU2403 family nucleotidyltransferase fold protein [Pseudorhodoferax sp.]|uniref:GSU2403 family nucleotidyltransferase fold protein n=1 Tax=Pseudorhodoferax sp. TaxID=1993553 RepID=UPI0039E48680